MMPVIPVRVPASPSPRSGAFFDPTKPIPHYPESESGESEDGEHPLLAKAHPTTLPLLAKLACERTYRSKWDLSEQLRPYDIVCERTKDESQL